ncbi:uncharacterized protein A1O9_00159 [Exophiala aquamarina CBS 119918]|uniref:SHSP domain-containing protein n=1 Tax=Exophiala aquamarina CBS 119918 TaxID=1182545 RepID=A0A072PR07_9EURO|nr:uncharacterized protein A1O9_00159 [Exophiala aquamarina CBS 119918]KEF62187.1 hypothetical protein A1O9_00159 [Exophiala aquamarina CBS 119918]
MSFLFPRIAYAPVPCSPARHEVAPLFSLLDETFNELQRASRQARKPFNPRFNVNETKEAYSLEGELPGIDQQNLSIEFVDEHTLTIKGRTESHTESGRRPEAVETEKKAAVEDTPVSETSSVKSHQATVEDEEPANASAVTDGSTEVAAATPTAEPAKTETPATPQSHRWISERHVGEFTRSFSFPARVNQDAVKASLKNGILSIVVPKAPVAESRRINIE